MFIYMNVYIYIYINIYMYIYEFFYQRSVAEILQIRHISPPFKLFYVDVVLLGFCRCWDCFSKGSLLRLRF